MANQTIQRVFTGGEIAPALHARADLSKYMSGLGLCKNMIILPQGGCYSRPGTLFIGELGDSTRQGRLIDFSFNTQQTYILVFENLKMRVIRNDGFVLAGAGPAIYELTTPYTEAELPFLNFVQDADVMTISHPSHQQRKLSRTDHDSWSLNVIDYNSSVTVPSNVAVVGVGTQSGEPNKTYTYVVTAVVEGVESLPSSSTSFTDDALSTVWGGKVTWDAVADADYYRVYRDPSNGSGIYAWVGDSETLVFEDYNISPDISDAPPSENNPFPSANNYPAAVGFFQQRQIFANTNNEPQKTFCSQNGNEESMRFSRPARADDAIFFTIKAQQVNEIRHIIGLDSLWLMTSGGEWVVTEGQDRVLTPSTVGVRRLSTWGSSWVRPAVVGQSIIFVQDKQTKVRDLTYNVSVENYEGNELSIMAQHLFEEKEITEISYEVEPYGILWCVRNDGMLLGMTYQKEHSIWAWHQHSTEGLFESVATISDGNRDSTYVIVNRTIDGSTVRYVEKIQPRYTDAPENVWAVDSGLQYNGSAASTISGLDHLEGEDVAVVADGNEVLGLTVTGGQITLPAEVPPATKITIGLPYLPAMETLDIESDSMTDTLYGKEISVSEVELKILKSRGGHVVGLKEDGSQVGEAEEIKPRLDSDGYDALSLKTGIQQVTIQPSWSKGGKLRIEQRSPFPLAILAVIPTIDVS